MAFGPNNAKKYRISNPFLLNKIIQLKGQSWFFSYQVVNDLSSGLNCTNHPIVLIVLCNVVILIVNVIFADKER